MASDTVDFYAIEDWNPGVILFAVSSSNIRGLPPHGAALERLLSDFPFSRASRIVWQFLITPEGNHACPFLRAFHDVSFHADQGIASHPIDFLSHCGEAIDIAGSVGKI